jgi:hypothetical protein
VVAVLVSVATWRVFDRTTVSAAYRTPAFDEADTIAARAG